MIQNDDEPVKKGISGTPEEDGTGGPRGRGVRQETFGAINPGELLYRNLIERMPDGVYKSTHDGRFVEANPALVRILGYNSLEELLAVDIATQLYFEPEDRENLTLLEQAHQLDIFRMRKKDGSEIWVEDHGWYTYDESGKVLFHEGILRDITDRKRAEDALKDSENRYRVFINATRDMAFLKDDLLHYSIVNKALAVFFNKDEAGIIGKSDFELMSDEAARRCYISDQKALRTSELVISEEPINGRVYQTHKFRVPMSGGKYGIGGYVRDITDRQQAERQLQAQATELTELNAMKDKLFSIIAHDLRGPFNAILGLSDILRENYRELDEHAIESSLSAISEASRQAYTLLENLLIWSQSQTGRLAFNPIILSARAEISECVRIMNVLAEKKNISIRIMVADHLTLFADRNMLGTILRNLIGNAIKFTPRNGRIMISARHENGSTVVEVEDTGIGISSEKLQKLFKPDRDLISQGTEREKGSGIGLILCKEFVERHQGKIQVKSEPGKGSLFSVILPQHVHAG